MKQYLVNSLKEATETVGGWVRRATQAETEGLAANNRYVSPLRLGNYLATVLVEATESYKGLVERATQAETNARSINNRYVSPLRLGSGFSVLKATNGYLIFPTWLGRVVVQWGYTAADASSKTITFPVAFPTACRSVSCTAKKASNGGVGTDHAVKNFPTASNVVLTLNTGLEGVYWVAWGH